MGEDGASTVRREMQEELNVVVNCGALLYVAENFYNNGSRQEHEIGLYFLAHLPSGSALLSKSSSHHGVEGKSKLEFKWFPLSSLASVDLYPSFLIGELSSLSGTARHIVQHE